MRKYEFIVILDPSVEDGVVGESIEKYAKLIREQGGEVTHQENWGRRKFAYDINRKSEGTYLFLRLRGTSKVIDELNRALHFDERVIRSMIVLDDDAEARNAEAQRRRLRGAEAPPAAAPAPAQAEV